MGDKKTQPFLEKHCPFCGNNVLDLIEDAEDGGPIFWVKCVTCSAAGPVGRTSNEALSRWHNRFDAEAEASVTTIVPPKEDGSQSTRA